MKKYTAFIIAFALMLSLCACAKSDSGIIAAPQYPEMAKYPDQADYATASGELDHKKWSDANNAYFETLRVQREYASSCAGLESYLGALMTEFASDHSDKNIVYSPINIYLALGMLAEITDGNSRQQILDLLGENSVEAIREKCNAVWNACYRDTGNVTSIPGSSMWLQSGYSYREEVLNTLAENYYASSHSGEMGSSEYNSRFRNWLNENTRGLLESETKGIELKEDTRLALATTLYFSGGWSDEFSKSNTQKGRFSILDTDGATVECDFMHRTDSRSYFWGEKFSAVRQNFKDGGGMWLILPDNGVSVNEVAADSETLELIMSNGYWENSKYLTVNLTVPKFDVSDTTELPTHLRALGVTDVFDDSVSDFSPLAEEPLVLSRATHAARVKIDEEGCEAAAFTVLMAEPTSAQPPNEEIDFVLDRPFMFVITNDCGLPLFIGTVNRPA